ncbi:Pt1-cadherin-like protein [Leptotrombidium deliense]|uniref:Pt1-cadherin-like protein n=1 Tax=Leptotrombidium deliense TaxID=299467 RepID=A0A443S4L0_9ACAR|nr:Pt1-cadherin-like protein [Leptotrombidium deliense]
MFNLDKKDSQEVLKLKISNRYITVDSIESVRVKEPWDYEQLENKTIYFGLFVALPNCDIEHQSNTIHIIDFNDEPPEFINQPLPMQNVVDLNAPPGTSVFKLQANDPDTNHNIHYLLVRDRAGGRFEVDELSGEVRTRGNEPFLLNKEYFLYVKAEDHNGPLVDPQYQTTKEERLSIMGGRRPPQFFKSMYETLKRNPIHLTSGTFNIGPTSGIVKLASKLDYEDIRQPKQYLLLVTATEDSVGLSSFVEVKINVTDVNDNAPHFELDDYHAYIEEDKAIGSSILSFCYEQ